MIVPHDYFGSATGYSAKAPGVGVEIVLLNVEWVGGKLMGKTKVASAVTHQGCGLVQEGNDMGPLIPQISILLAPDNLLSFLHLVTSGCEVAFSATNVLMEGAPAACIMPILPMKVCGDPITVPFGYAPTNLLNSVWLDIPLVDFIAGCANIVATIVMDAIKEALSTGGPETSFANELAEVVLGKPPSAAGFAASNVPGLVTALVRLGGRLLCDDYEGDVSVEVGYSQGLIGGVSVGYTWGGDGSHQVSSNVSRAGGASRQGSQYQVNPDGSTQTSVSDRTVGGESRTETVTNRPDGSQRTETTRTTGDTERTQISERSADGQQSTTEIVRRNGTEVSRSSRPGEREL